MPDPQEMSALMDDLDCKMPINSASVGGGSERITVRLSGLVHRQIEEFVGARTMGLATVSDFVRKACDKYAIDMIAQNPNVRGILYHYLAMKEQIVDDMRQKEFAEMSATYTDWIGMLIAQGHEERARELVNKRYALTEQMPDGYWREKAREALEMEFGHLLGVEGDAVERPVVVKDVVRGVSMLTKDMR